MKYNSFTSKSSFSNLFSSLFANDRQLFTKEKLEKISYSYGNAFTFKSRITKFSKLELYDNSYKVVNKDSIKIDSLPMVSEARKKLLQNEAKKS